MAEPEPPPRPPRGEFLRRRNELWRQLRALEPGDPAAEGVIEELSVLTSLPRDKVLEGLGWT